MKRLSGIALPLPFLALLLAGCGGSSAGSVASAGAKGKATLNVIWPDQIARQIPVAANSLTVTLSQGGSAVATQTIARPAAGTNTTSTTFTALPVGSLDVAVSAFPTTDGTGVAQANGAGTMAVSVGTPGAVTVSLVSTVSTLAISPATPHIGIGGTGTLTASARDASNNIVLLQATGVEPITWTSSAPGILTIAGTGPVATATGVAAGSSTITARFVTDDAGDVVTGTTSASVVAGSGTVTIK